MLHLLSFPLQTPLLQSWDIPTSSRMKKKKKGKIHIALISSKKTRNKYLHLFLGKCIFNDVTTVKALLLHEGFVVIPEAADSSLSVS